MARHSHWASIKHKKGVTDARRGKLFSKLAKHIISAVRTGGGDPEMNLRLKYAIEKARQANMPRDNIERAIKRGTGEIGGAAIEECVYGGYGPGGVAVIVEALTDNRARTAGEIRNLFDKRGGKMADLAAVANLFDKKSQLVIRQDACPEEALMEAALAHGADNVETVGETYEVSGEVAVFDSLRKGLEEQKIPVESAELAWIPRMTIPLDRTLAEKVLALLEDLEEHEDVKASYANLEVSEADLSAMGG